MDRQLSTTLHTLGYTDKEVHFYLASFNLGNASINDIAKAAKIQRSTAYLIANKLLEKGLVTEDFKVYGKTMVAAEPKVLLRMLRAKQRQIGRREIELEENLDELQALYQSPEIRPKVRTFEGTSGLLTVWKDILSAKGEILMWTDQDAETRLFSPEHHSQFIEQRIQNKLPARVLAVANQKGKDLQRNDANCLRTTRILPEATIFNAETYIYDSKVAILDYNQDIIGIIIESSEVSQAQRAMFETVWAISK